METIKTLNALFHTHLLLGSAHPYFPCKRTVPGFFMIWGTFWFIRMKNPVYRSMGTKFSLTPHMFTGAYYVLDSVLGTEIKYLSSAIELTV